MLLSLSELPFLLLLPYVSLIQTSKLIFSAGSSKEASFIGSVTGLTIAPLGPHPSLRLPLFCYPPRGIKFSIYRPASTNGESLGA